MFTGALNRRIQNIILFCVVTITLIVTPWANLDPINLPKFLILVAGGFAILGNLLPFWGKFFKFEASSISYSIAIFVFCLLAVFSINASFLQVYGSYGRNTGLLAYFALAIFFLSIIGVTNYSFAKRLIYCLVLVGFVNAIYGLFQWLGKDIFAWSGSYDPVVGTLGNSNFTSALLGMSSIILLTLSLATNYNLNLRIMFLVFLILNLFVIYKSNSIQGILIFLVTSTLVVWIKFIRPISSIIFNLTYCAVIVFTMFVGVIGILNKGPLAGVLYQDSVTYRGDYWRAGWKMTTENPLFGVGLDSYGDWYRFARNEAAALRRGPDVTSNSAHNVFLDISSNGGLLLLTAYLLILGMVIRSALRLLRKSVVFDAVGVGLVTAWLAYLVQSIISINQLGLAIWGWALGGAIIGYDLYRDRADAPRSKRAPGKRPEQVPASVVVTGAVGLVLGFALSIWPVAKDVSFRSALQSGDPAKIESAAGSFPQITYYYIYGAQIFLDNKLEDKALEMAKKAIEINELDFNAYKALVANPKVSEADKQAALAKMKELDPFNNTLGQ